MRNKLRLLVCYLLICAIVPINLTYAQPSIDDRAGDGIHIDDIVYYLYHTGSLSNSDETRNLLAQIAPILPSPSAAEVAAGITNVKSPAADETSLTLPTVPTGYTIGIYSSSNVGVIGTNGVIVPPAVATSVDLVFAVIRTSDNTTANTVTFTVIVPAITEVIDLSNNAINGTSFGSLTGNTGNEVKRWQTFTAIGYPNLTSVDVRIHKRGGTSQSDVTVQLFATSNNKPIGSPLTSTTISSSSVGTEYSSIKVLLTYNGLTNGIQYAIVLGQTTNSDESNYEWLTGPSGTAGENFGKFDGASTWTDETNIGYGWLKVHVN